MELEVGKEYKAINGARIVVDEVYDLGCSCTVFHPADGRQHSNIGYTLDGYFYNDKSSSEYDVVSLWDCDNESVEVSDPDELI